MKLSRFCANRIKKNLSQNAGFTLVELIIVITILAILCGLSAVGILSWQDWATFKKENEYAQTLFVAAQNQLTEYVANERIIDMQEDLLAENGVDADGYIIYKAADGISTVDYKTLQTDESLSNLWTDDRADIIVSLSAGAGDYNAYLANPEGVSKDKYWLFELLGNYVYDASILNNGAITVEFTPEDGQVFAVIYTDKHSSFDGLDLLDRKEASRRPNMIGYYGVDSLSKATKNTLVKDKINVHKVRLYNKETLYLTFMVDELNTFNLATAGTTPDLNTMYTVDLLAKDKSTKLLTISFSGRLAGANAPDKDKKQNAKVTRYETNEEGKPVVDITYDDLPILAWISEKDTVEVLLDAADIAADAYTYNAGYDNIFGNVDEGNAQVKASADSFRNTYSFFRFGLDVQDIYVQVQVSADDYKESDIVGNSIAQGARNTVFAGGDDDEYSIRNARHLYNIRYMEVTKAYDSRNASKAQNESGISFVVNADIDWAKFQHEEVETNGVKNVVGHLYDSSLIGTKSVSSELAALTTNTFNENLARYQCGFPSIPTIRAKDTLKGKENALGKTDVCISGIYVSEADNEIYKSYQLSNGSAGTIKPAGLVNVNYGTIINLTMDKLTVSGEDYVGGFVGVNVGKVSNLTLDNTLDASKKDTSIITGKKNVGGIIGLQLATNDENKTVTNYKAYDNAGAVVSGQRFVVLSELENNARVEGKDAVGGIVGSARNEFSFISAKLNELDGLSDAERTFISNLTETNTNNCNIAISNCENYGPVLAAEDEENCRYIGGIAGYTYNKDEDNTYRINITECKSSPQYDKATITTMLATVGADPTKLKGTYVGGIVGYNYHGQINACSAQPKNAQSGYVFGNKYVGGIAGLNIGPIRGKVGITEVASVNQNHVVAYDFAGGITGCNAAISYKDADGNPIISRDPEDLKEAILAPSTTVDLTAKIDNWTNKGIVVAINEYSGGITGYNTGWLYRCDSEVTEDMIEEGISGMYSGAYVGGIAGYNNGVVGNTDRTVAADGKSSKVVEGQSDNTLGTECFVRGTDYVGGIVGYNDTKSIIEDYQVTGGHVIGASDGHFTGGYVGFNAAVDLIMNTETLKARNVRCNPSEVDGGYFAGGIIGGNILNTNGLELEEEYVADDIVSEITATNRVAKESEIYGVVDITAASGDQGWGRIIVYNNSDRDLYTWRVLVNPIENTSDYPNLNFYNDQLDILTHCVRPNNVETEKIEPGKSIDMWFAVNETSEEELAAFKKANTSMKVYYFDSVDNKVETYWGMAENANDCTYGKPQVYYASDDSDYDGNPGPYLVNCAFSVTNNTSHIMPNWRIEMEIPKSANIKECKFNMSRNNASEINYNLQYDRKGDIATLIANTMESSYLTNKNSFYITVTIEFEKEEERTRFLNQTPIITFNNVVYKYPAEMEGKFNFTSGGSSSGGNSSSEEIETTFKKIAANYVTDNFLGELKGKAFVGGYIGYNCIIDNGPTSKFIEDNKADYPDKNATYILQKKFIMDAFEESDKNVEKFSEEALLAQKKAILDDLVKTSGVTVIDTTATDSDKFGMFIQGVKTENSVQAQTITGEIYVGGVLGYNDDNAPLYIIDVENATPVVATKAIEYIAEQPLYVGASIQIDTQGNTKYRTKDYLDREFTYTYSYAGGIIGKVARETTIDACRNTSTGTVTADGTYTGGICEINEGTVKNCEVPVFANTNQNYLGGLCGLNKHTGVITDCKYVSTENVISGTNMVGAIASENFGTIRKITFIDPKMNVIGVTVGEEKEGVAGLYAAYNCGIIEVENDLPVNIVSGGRYVGAIAGINAGKVTNNKADANKATGSQNRTKALIVSGTVKGDMTVGGFIGLNKGTDTINYLLNTSTVTATNGNAGGIVGEAEGARIEYCFNEADVTAINGNAGGITSSNAGVIIYCENYKVVNAPNGMCGGIVSINKTDGTISDNTVTPLAADETLTFTSSKAIGAIAAQNDGIVKDNLIQRIILTNGSSDVTNMGTIVGENLTNGTIIIPTQNQIKINNSKVIANSNACNIGGIAGLNAGTITSEVTGTLAKVTSIDLELSDGTLYASMGSVAGKNTGTIEYIAGNATISGYHGADGFGYGGIAGTSEGGTIQNCSFEGTVTATGSGEEIVSIGGIVGYVNNSVNINGVDNWSTITNAYINGVTGGIVGFIKSNGSASISNARNCVDITNYGITGGIIGQLAGNGASLNACSNYGDLSNEYDALSGIIGCYSDYISGSRLLAISCNSYGNIERNLSNNVEKVYVGGFIGKTINGSDSGLVDFGDCVNFGIIKAHGATGVDASNMGSYFGNVVGTIRLDLCQNYNTYVKEDAGSAEYAAINYNGNSTIVMALKDCIDDSGNKNVDELASSMVAMDSNEMIYYITSTNFTISDFWIFNRNNSFVQLKTNDRTGHVYREKDVLNGFYMNYTKNNPDKVFGDHNSYGKQLLESKVIGSSGNRKDVYLDLSNRFKNYLRRTTYVPVFSTSKAKSSPMMLLDLDDDLLENADLENDLEEDLPTQEDDEEITPTPSLDNEAGDIAPEVTPEPTPEVTPDVDQEDEVGEADSTPAPTGEPVEPITPIDALPSEEAQDVTPDAA